VICREGFDPFGDRDGALLVHAENCPQCGEVLRVLGVCNETWKQALAKDQARAFFRERRLNWARPPARTVTTTLVFAVVVAALSGYALARHGGAHVDTRSIDQSPPSIDDRSPPSPSVVAPRSVIDDEPPPEPSAEASVAPAPIEPPRTPPSPPTATPTETSRALWERAVALLDAGDRANAEQAFRRVMELPSAEPGLRSRATFRWAQLLLSRGDRQTPREPLLRLVRGGDALGFDAALLLERCAPDERARIWDTYLERATDPTLRAQALAHR
jgi:hypothetical protein